MSQSQAVALITNWQSWDGRIVNGKYPLRQYLGSAGEGAVYLTEVDGRDGVIKLLPADAGRARAQVASWNLAEGLSHPNLVRVFENGLWHADDEHDMLFSVMEYCEESLVGVLRQRALTPSEARVMLATALEALKYLHRQGVLHGQFTPANILATGDQLKLTTDYVRRCTDAEGASTGSPYDAPEKAAGTTSLSSDAWAVGVTLCEALTRRLPTRDKDGNPELPEKLPAPFDEIVKGCLIADRERRLSIAAIGSLLERPAPELVKAKAPATQENAPVTNIRTNRPSVSPAAPESPTAKESRDRHKILAGKLPALIAVAALVLLFAILIGIRLSEHRKPTSQPSAAAVSPHAASSAPATRASGVVRSQTGPAAPGSVVHQVTPVIPSKAMSTIQGTVKVKVKVVVTADGKVSRASLETRGPSAYFSRQALEAAREWTFAPPMMDGRAQASEWTLRFEFRRSGTKTAAQRRSPA